MGGFRTGSPARRPLLVVAATLLAISGTLAPARAPVAQAASDGLDLSTAATYTIVPARHVVRVVVDVTARNTKPNVTSGGIVTKYFYEGARIAVQSAARNVHATANGVALTATTKPDDGFAIVEVRFRDSLFYHQTTTVRVTYDLPGGAPRSTSEIRVGTAFATFVAWAFGDTGSVRVVVPAGFEAEATGSDVTQTTSGGATIFRAAGITDIGGWYLLVNADRKSALTEQRIDLSGGEHVVVRGWPEDAAWRKRVTDLLTRGLPKLVEEVGLDWPVAGDLSVAEVHTPLLEGYSGFFLEGADKIEVSEDLDDMTIVHEASHAWFNTGLFVGRWINEGFANAYAAKVLDAIGETGDTPERVSPTDATAVRLVDWVFPGRITDVPTEERERYGYNASWTVIRTIVAEIGDDGMRRVFAAAQDHVIAYPGSGSPEAVTEPNDWRRLLDLFDEAGGATTADELFRQWVVTDAQAKDLDDRAKARAEYADLVAAGAGWQAPYAVRSSLSAWFFTVAEGSIAEARAVLARRDEIRSKAAQLGVTPPANLQAAYEATIFSFRDANQIAADQIAALDALATAASAVAAPRAPFVTLGLIGTHPEADLAGARSAFDAGAPDAVARAAAVTAVIDGSVAVGRQRAIAGLVGLIGALALLLVLVIVLRRRRGQRRRSAAAASAALAESALSSRDADAMPPSATSLEPEPEPPYATLADQPSRPPDQGDA